MVDAFCGVHFFWLFGAAKEKTAIFVLSCIKRQADGENV
ncbi:hypothetical protein M493_06660 [Geobacillus genomosp. 3]|uniref:Uncharacterized protein n=1 Tax=Geobacillus genomosp. 3 TaxID=1921421 RepID=S5YY45_GEOG3|nr:hypothetical protein M493_06660 [Geobacillus genomosp. 3]